MLNFSFFSTYLRRIHVQTLLNVRQTIRQFEQYEKTEHKKN